MGKSPRTPRGSPGPGPATVGRRTAVAASEVAVAMNERRSIVMLQALSCSHEIATDAGGGHDAGHHALVRPVNRRRLRRSDTGGHGGSLLRLLRRPEAGH